jgi:pimeloyl-ACP methyl ester carboxylesterase
MSSRDITDKILPGADPLLRPVTIDLPDGGTIAALFHEKLEPDAKDIHETPDDHPLRDGTLIVMAHHAPGGHKAAENDIFGDLEHHLSHDGFDTIRFDFRGCGASSGRVEDMSLASIAQDMNAVYGWAREHGYERLVLVGDGIGALAVLMNMSPQVKALVLLWPVLQPQDSYFADAFARMDEEQAKQDGFVALYEERISLRLLRELKNADLRPVIAALRCPVLVQHGEDDKHIPLSQLDILKQHGAKARRIEITTYEGGQRGLRQLQERRTLFYHTRQFLNRYC